MITEDHKDQYKENGFFVLPKLISGEKIWSLQGEYKEALTTKRALMPELERPTFLPDFSNFCNDHAIQNIGLEILGPACRIMGEKFVIKWPTEKGERPYIHFWHQDSAYIGAKHPPYLTCLIAIDRSTEENAALAVMPITKFGSYGLSNHMSKGKVDKFQRADSLAISYDGEMYPGEKRPNKHVIDLDPGDVLVFSSLNLHGSGINRSKQIRRSYLVHFSDGIIRNAKGDLFWRCDSLE